MSDPSAFQANIEIHTLLKKLPQLTDVADWVVFLASDQARAMTGAIINLTCGEIAD
jgi:3-oxoacyl-[acyl-carrier protein] reductase